MSDCFFSIIAPVYNVQEYLEKCVKSVLSQSFKNYELILIDDGSTDGCPQLCDKMGALDPRVKVFHKKNQGVAVARNFGIQKAAGQYLLFLDSDDSFADGLLERLYKKIEGDSPDIVVFGYQRVAPNGGVINLSVPSKEHTISIMHKENADLTFLLWNKAYKKSLFDSVNLSLVAGITFSEDSYLTLALQKNACKIAFLDQVGYNYLCRAQSVTQNMSLKNHLDRIKAVQLMDALYDSDAQKPQVLKNIKFDTKFFYVDPNNDYSAKTFFKNCGLWRDTFKESSLTFTNKAATRKMRLYLKLIQFRLDFLAYILYRLKR